jgi:hypothetical protein
MISKTEIVPGEIKVDRSDILHAIKQASQENDFLKDIESVSMTRLYKHQVRRG